MGTKLASTDAEIEQSVREMVVSRTGGGDGYVAPWPGVPVTMFTITMHDALALRRMLDRGELRLIERPRSHRPGTVSYVAFAEDATAPEAAKASAKLQRAVRQYERTH